MSNLSKNMWHLDINHPSQAMWDLTYMVATYLPTYLVRWLILCTMPRMTTRTNHPKWFEKWNGKFSTMFKGISG
jgi:hypothetical protein